MIEGSGVKEQWGAAVESLMGSCFRENMRLPGEEFALTSFSMFAEACIHATLDHPEWALGLRTRFEREGGGALPSEAALRLAREFMLNCRIERIEV